jgi:hypothetical protein
MLIQFEGPVSLKQLHVFLSTAIGKKKKLQE